MLQFTHLNSPEDITCKPPEAEKDSAMTTAAAEIEITVKDGSFKAYMAAPKIIHGQLPAIIVIQEIFGVNKDMREKCDELAAEGFLAISPDLFWRMEPGVQLTDKSEAEWAKAFDLMTRFDLDKGVEDLKATLDYMRSVKQCNGVVGNIGYCLGGKLAFLMSTRTTTDASVCYYGVGLDELVVEAGKIQKPVMLHVAEEDKFVSKEAQDQIKQGLQDTPLATVYSYAGVNHAFARMQGEHYDAPAATLANKRTKAFLKEHLKK